VLADGVSDLVDFEATFNKQYVRQKLGNGLVRIWHDVQARVSAYLLGSDLALYKFDEFVQVLRVVHRFVFLCVSVCSTEAPADCPLSSYLFPDTEHCSGVVSTPASYSGGTRLRSSMAFLCSFFQILR
jgi:hypothetical protein